jgi:hypothetical protein
MKRIGLFLTAAAVSLLMFSSLSKSQTGLLLTHFSADGSGTGTTSTASGSVTGSFGGQTGTAAFSVSAVSASDSYTSNGQGGFCDRITGSITLTTADGSTLTMQHGGISCNTGVGQSSPAIDQSVYIVTSGTGKFANASGTGTFSLGWYNSPQHFNDPALVLVHFDGNLMI